MYAGHWAQWSGPLGLGFAVGEGASEADGAGGGVGMLAFPLPAALGPAELSLPPVQAGRNAATPARAVPCRKRRRDRSGLRGWVGSVMSSSSARAHAGTFLAGSPTPDPGSV